MGSYNVKTTARIWFEEELVSKEQDLSIEQEIECPSVEFNYLKSVVPKGATTGVSRTAAGFENFAGKSCCAGDSEVLQSYLLKAAFENSPLQRSLQVRKSYRQTV
jgi:hypothetical protein